ncbi:MAG: disulfide oxidoreductase [Patescibacteria group bacterium]
MTKLQTNILYTALAQAIVAMLGSLYFSEVMKLPPCILCWYQRIVMYPLVVVLAVGIIRRNKDIALYVLPLSLVGLGISIYHNLLYWKIIPENLAPCVAGISCTTKFFEWFGFITIPFLALVAFVVINACMVIFIKNNK